MKPKHRIPVVDLTTVAQRKKISVADVGDIVSRAHKSLVPVRKTFAITEHGKARTYVVTRRGIGYIKTPHGEFWQYNFSVNDRWKKYSILVKGPLCPEFQPQFKKHKPVMIRIDSGCESGQKFCDYTCECREQLALAMQQVAKNGEGIIINIPEQDGRGMGNPFKLATLVLQELLDLNTVEAASVLTCARTIDKRTYGGVVAILQFLGIDSTRGIRLITNNSHKFNIFRENGYRTSRVNAVIPPTEHTIHHLTAKQAHLGHEDLVSSKARAS